ncbi:MAG: LamG domain-containing protein, partial [Dehalococcoidia bacterium]|nr:LamG domain-containing protein [Dehalococcoidia bacterium]
YKGLGFRITSGNAIAVWCRVNGSDQYKISCAAPTDEAWHHIVIMYDSTTHYQTLWLDGVKIGDGTCTGTGTYLLEYVSTTLTIGSGNTSGQFFVGSIDEVRYYSRILTPEEIAYNYNSGAGRYIPYSIAGIIGWWHADEGDGLTVADSSSEGNAGTITGATWVAGLVIPDDDISAYTKSITTERGRDSDLGDVQVSTAELRVVNTSKNFSPEYSSGAYYGKLKPMRPIRIQATYGGSTYDVFYGYITKIVPNPSKKQQDAYIHAVGQLSRFQTKVTTELLEDVGEDEVIAAIIDAVERPAETIPNSLDTGEDSYSYAKFTATNGLEALSHVIKSCCGRVYDKADGTIVFESRGHRALSPHDASVYTLNEDHYSMTYAYGERELLNRFTTKAHARTALSTAEVWRNWDTPYIPAGETLTINAILAYPALSITTPAATTDYTANNQADGLGTDRTADVSITLTEYAESIGIAVENTGATGFYLTFIRLRGDLLQETDEGSSTINDTDSQADYGIREDEFDSALLDDLSDAQNRSRYLLARHKDPHAEITVTLRPDDDTKLAAMLGRDISDRITVIEAQTAVNADFFIEKVAHHFEPSFMETQWTLSAIGVQDFILDTSVLDGDDVLSY